MQPPISVHFVHHKNPPQNSRMTKSLKNAIEIECHTSFAVCDIEFLRECIDVNDDEL